MNWRGEIKTTDLAAVNAGEKIRRPEPIRVQFAVRDTPDGLAVDTFDCKSNFLIVRASGTRQKGSVEIDFNLDRLIQDAGGLLDLGSVKIAGEGLARASWNRQNDGRFDANGKFQVDRFQWFVPQRLDWNEKHLTGALVAAGLIDASGNRRLDRLDVNIETAGELTKLNLLEPVFNFDDRRPLKFGLYSRGQLARWQSRIGPWVGSTAWKLAGDYELNSKANYAPGAAELQDAKLAITKLSVAGPSLRIAEPKVDLTLTGRVQPSQRRIEVDVAKILSDSFVAQLDQFRATMPAKESETMTMSGKLYSETYVQRLLEWLGYASDWRFQGKLVNRIEVNQDGQGVSARFETRADNLVATHRSGQRHEGNILLTGSGATDSLGHTFRFDQVTLKSRTARDELVQGNLTGKIGWANGRPDLQLQGTLDPNMNEVTKILQASFGPAIRVAGRSSNPFEYRGPLISDKSTGSAAFRWDAAEFYGFQLGPADVKADYAAGVVRITPLVFTANEGRVQLGPSARLVPSPALLALEPGRAIEQVRIHPAMCAAALQYVSPVLANVATAEGRFSIDLDGCQIPLANPSQGEVAGKFIVHDIQIGPGPNHLIHEIAKLIGRTAPARLKRDSVVPFRMTGGRVYHDQMELEFSNVTIRTKGSVGINDQSLAILVQMPIPAKWQSNPLAAGLFKDGITVPVGGTLSSPRIDPNAIEQIIRQTFEKAALDARNTAQQQLQQQMQQQLQQQFNRVLPPSGAAPAKTTTPRPSAAMPKSPSPSLLKLKR
jgi:translocation and assembly module TamB